MGPRTRFPRRFFLLSTTAVLATACQTIPFLSTKATAPRGPEQTLDRYFTLLATGQYSDAENLMSPSFQARLGHDGTQTLLHSVDSARVTNVEDAVQWANGLGARLPSPPPDRREYLVTLEVAPSVDGKQSWSDGTNRRFVDLVRQGGRWLIDSIAASPGVLITGLPTKTQNQTTVVLPPSPLLLGPAPVDRAIYTARQDAADHGGIAWATDPVQVVHRDGPSFGLDSSDSAEILRRDTDPVSLVPRAFVVIHQGQRTYLVTLIQPIRSGPGGVWAIEAVATYSPLPD
ncbi:MAG TPA: hypothetical protein VNL16_01445 [Chloroflexota bacterium]|nr:hypothetical protein [Chloroflexota bacterium]